MDKPNSFTVEPEDLDGLDEGPVGDDEGTKDDGTIEVNPPAPAVPEVDDDEEV